MPPSVRVQLGEEALARRGQKWLERNRGLFVAIKLKNGEVIADAESLERLYELLAVVRPKEDYYVGRVGYATLGPLLV